MQCNYLIPLIIFIASGCGRSYNQHTEEALGTAQRVGGDCEAGYCEIMYLGMPEELNETDTSAGWFEAGQKLIIRGRAFRPDGKTPAPDVIIYYHHTDNNGYYSPGNGAPENSTRHGHIRGWVLTDAEGKYTIYTNRPGPYPDTDLPAHVHWLIKEPEIKNEYWIDDLTFQDDPRLAPHYAQHPPGNIGGSGIAEVTYSGEVQIVEPVLILGKNVLHYPKK